MRPSIRFLSPELIERILAEARQLLASLGVEVHHAEVTELLLAGGATRDEASGRIRIGEDKLTFAHNSAVIPENGKEILDRLIPVIGDIAKDEVYQPWIGKIAIEGHTSSVGTDLVNWNLSAARAIAVTKYILEHADEQYMEQFQDKLEAIGRSYRDLIRDDQGNENPDLSRRIEIKLLFKNPEEWLD